MRGPVVLRLARANQRLPDLMDILSHVTTTVCEYMEGGKACAAELEGQPCLGYFPRFLALNH